MKILIAEDDATSRHILTAMLDKWGYEVIATCDGVQAWEARQQPGAPRLAILDWMMPGMDGVDVCRKVREIETQDPPYIIMLTSKTEKAEIVAALDAGANDYLAKPFDSGELRARVEVGRRMVEMQDELLKSRKALLHQANHDPLTGLPNRRAILDRLQKELARAARHSDVVSVGMCDIDHFKAVNDTYGHPSGDDVLCRLARILTGCCREYDAVGRMGGEEFLLIVPMKADMTGTQIRSLYDRHCLSVAEAKMETRSGALSVTVSIGAAIAKNGDTVDDLLAVADAALYRAKSEGRNRVVVADKDVVDRLSVNQIGGIA